MSEMVQTEPAKGLAFEDLALGMSASLENAVRERDIQSFAEITGDRNPVHLDTEYASTTRALDG